MIETKDVAVDSVLLSERPVVTVAFVLEVSSVRNAFKVWEPLGFWFKKPIWFSSLFNDWVVLK